MCDNNKFYICEHCGNLIGMIHDAGVPMMCCGQKMTKLEPGTKFEDLPEDFECPLCGVGKDNFSEAE